MRIDKQVDVIIPIYNAFEDLEICVDSLIKNTDLQKNRVILVNDNSSDERIRPYLDSLKSESFIVVHNKENKGFSNNINIGMSQSEENDVVLLNSDTIVTARWLEKMQSCAYLNQSIGTVTPLSNNATLCSVPKAFDENVLPEYLDVESAGEIVERCSLKRYPQISVAHGFCMYVKREVIDKIGHFDAETFKKGYGEENDFCNRAVQMGYINVMCDDTYIYHSGTKSFLTKEKEQLIADHEKILKKRYPVQMKQNEEYCFSNPNKLISDNVGIYFDVNNGKKNILYVVHSDFDNGKNDNIGGTQFHVRDLCYGLKNSNNIFVLSRDLDFLSLTIYVGDNKHQLKFHVGDQDAFILDSNIRIKRVIDLILDAFRIDLVHVHHVISLSFDIFECANCRSIPVILTAHDFYYICPTIKLLNDGKYCNGVLTENCDKCIFENLGIVDGQNYIEIWRNRCRCIFEKCEQILVPSDSTRRVYLQIYPEIENKLTIIEHGTDIKCIEPHVIVRRDSFNCKIKECTQKDNYLIFTGEVHAKVFDADNERFCYTVAIGDKSRCVEIELEDIDYSDGIKGKFSSKVDLGNNDGESIQIKVFIDDGSVYYLGHDCKNVISYKKVGVDYKLRIAFIGGLDEAKGSKIVNQIVDKSTRDVKYYTIGTIGDRDLSLVKKSNYSAIGKYRRDELTDLLSFYDINVIGLLSIWPETFSYTLSEAISTKLPVIVTDIGALGERTKKYKCGYCVSMDNSVDEFVDKVNMLKNDRQAYDVLFKIVSDCKLKSISEMLVDYEKLYSRVLDDTKPVWGDDWNREAIAAAWRLCNSEFMIDGIAVSGNLLHQWKKDANEYKILKTTLTYSLMKRILTMRFPFQKGIMKVIDKLRGIKD